MAEGTTENGHGGGGDHSPLEQFEIKTLFPVGDAHGAPGEAVALPFYAFTNSALFMVLGIWGHGAAPWCPRACRAWRSSAMSSSPI